MFLRATSIAITRRPLRGRPAIRALAIGLVLVSGCGIDDPDRSDECWMPSPPKVCSQGEERPCSDGPSGADGASICSAGTQVCNLQQTGFDACLGQVLAAPDDCAAPTSFSCDAQNHCGSVSQPEAPFGDASDALVSVDAQGNLAFAIYRRRGSGLPGMAIQKRAPDGTPIWSVDLTGHDECAAAVVGMTHALDDDVLVFGFFGIPEGCTLDLGTGPLTPQSSMESSAFVARYAASNGRPRWVRTWPGGIAGLAADASGGFVIGGPYIEASWLGSLELPVPTQGVGAYVARLDASGEPVWVKTYDDNRNIHRVAVDGAGTVHALSQRPGEGVKGMCMPPMSSVVTALEADGTPRFERPIGSDSTPVGLAVDTSGRVAVLVSIESEWGARGPLDLGGATVDGSAFLAVLDPAQGHIVWARSLYEWEPGAVMVDAHDDVILAGAHRSRVTVARYARDGALFSLASGSEGFVTSAARTTAGRAWVTAASGDATGARTASLRRADP